jgi:hypothetical protein
MHRTGRSANICNRLSTGLRSAALNLIELQRGHSRRSHTKCGIQSGQFRFEKFMQNL